MYPGRHTKENPDKPAIIMAGSGEVLTFAQYDARANQVAQFFRDQGLRHGDHVAILMENSARMLEIEGGAERTGLYYTLVNSYLSSEEVAYLLTDCQAKVFFSSVAKEEVARKAAADCSGLQRLLMVGLEPGPERPSEREPAADGRWEPFESTVGAYPIEPVTAEELGTPMLYSSGTTGRPKGIFRPLPVAKPDEPLAVLAFTEFMFGYREGMVYLSPAPLYHSAPQAAVSGALRFGATAVIMEQFDAEHWCALVAEHRVTHSQLVPTMFNRLLRLPQDVRDRYDLSSLERIVHAAAPCPVPVKEGMIEWVGPILTEYYGATEANGFTLCHSDEWLQHKGTVGRPVLGELVILDEDGQECAAGVDGTVWFRGATNFEYFGDPAKTAENRTADGSTSTVGDIGHVDDDGYLYLTDRKSYMIISGGVNIYP
ncbi:MAG: AMP-binding protein, partial [Actinomycetota bacterium]|nr:AMP-binding protein [Actinomycetota bacterium]